MLVEPFTRSSRWETIEVGMPRLERERVLARIVTLKRALEISRTEPGRRALRDALADYEDRLAELRRGCGVGRV